MDEEALRLKFDALAPALNERMRRLLAAAEARAIGRGGIAAVCRASGVSRSTVERGLLELDESDPLPPEATRRRGAGRKLAIELDPTLLEDLEALVEPTQVGDPMSPLKWTSKSVRKLSQELQAMGHAVSYRTVGSLLGDLGYSLQLNKKSKEGKQHVDRDQQFRYINRLVRRMQRAGQPVISVDAKKKELVGDFKSTGKAWRPKKNPEPVRVHDFIDPELGKANPYGVYDLSRNTGWVSIGIDHDTASFAVKTISRWWKAMGTPAYPEAGELMITADSGGSNGSRVRLWKLELQELADKTGMKITVCHFPPGTSKWNKIEHRLFSFISTSWRGQPLVSLAVIVNLIAATKTETGLRVRCEIDKGTYPKGVIVSDEEMETINITRHTFQGDWNYTIHPRTT